MIPPDRIKFPAHEREFQLKQLPFPAPHQSGAAEDRSGGAVVGAVSQQIGSQGIPQGDHDEGREESDGNQEGDSHTKHIVG